MLWRLGVQTTDRVPIHWMQRLNGLPCAELSEFADPSAFRRNVAMPATLVSMLVDPERSDLRRDARPDSRTGRGLNVAGIRLKDPSRRACSARWHDPAERPWLSLPSPTYVVAGADRMIPPEAQRAMAKRAGSTVTEVAAGSHAVYVSQPDAIADVIEQAATGVSAAAQ
jgi:pimeloyl-ACP methyl ester carboxylesterase